MRLREFIEMGNNPNVQCLYLEIGEFLKWEKKQSYWKNKLFKKFDAHESHARRKPKEE